MSVLRRASRAAAGLLPTAALARLGLPALAAAIFLAALAAGVACWVISSGDRSDRVIRMIYARRGDAQCLPQDARRSSPTSPRRGRARPQRS